MVGNDIVGFKVPPTPDFNPGDIIRIKDVDYWGRQFMVVAMDFDYTTLEYYCTIKEVGTDWIKTQVSYTNLRHIVNHVEKTKMGRLLYGGNT